MKIRPLASAERSWHLAPGKRQERCVSPPRPRTENSAGGTAGRPAAEGIHRVISHACWAGIDATQLIIIYIRDRSRGGSRRQQFPAPLGIDGTVLRRSLSIEGGKGGGGGQLAQEAGDRPDQPPQALGASQNGSEVLRHPTSDSAPAGGSADRRHSATLTLRGRAVQFWRAQRQRPSQAPRATFPGELPSYGSLLSPFPISTLCFNFFFLNYRYRMVVNKKTTHLSRFWYMYVVLLFKAS